MKILSSFTHPQVVANHIFLPLKQLEGE